MTRFMKVLLKLVRVQIKCFCNKMTFYNTRYMNSILYNALYIYKYALRCYITIYIEFKKPFMLLNLNLTETFQ